MLCLSAACPYTLSTCSLELLFVESAWMVTSECIPDLGILSRLLCLSLPAFLSTFSFSLFRDVSTPPSPTHPTTTSTVATLLWSDFLFDVFILCSDTDKVHWRLMDKSQHYLCDILRILVHFYLNKRKSEVVTSSLSDYVASSIHVQSHTKVLLNTVKWLLVPLVYQWTFVD